MTSASIVAAALLCAFATTVVWQVACRRIPEPVATDESKRAYRDLAGPRLTLLVVLASAASGSLVAHTAPSASWAIWAVLSTVGVVIAGLDAFTTWMPRSLAHWSWVVLAVAIAGTAFWSPAMAIAGLVGAVAAGLLFGLIWLISRQGFGFGDVRYMPLIGAATATISLNTFETALICGALLVVAWAIIDRAIHHRIRFLPWGPAYWLAALAALALH
ncbi:hypothetical protein [Acidipropionibacterium acidipropionici]|nr:hypothetical protein [Acidipropionibacterium acidipropionici]